jgi:hypothetical protein
MASLCDFTDSDGFVTSVPSSPGGGITQDDITTLVTYQARGEPVPGCASSGGGDDDDRGGGQAPPPEPAPEPGRSQLSVQLDLVKSYSPEEVTVFWTVSNEIISGGGEKLSGTVVTELDGQPVEQQPVTAASGERKGGSVRLADVSKGTHEVCVRLA